jgi:hypothetical protein
MRRRSGQALTEFAVLYAGVVLPLTFMIVFVSEMLWVWHSVVDFTRDGARYAATHCWMADAGNVAGTGGYMPTHPGPVFSGRPDHRGPDAFQLRFRRMQRRLRAGRGEREHHQLPVHALLGFFQAACGRHPALHRQRAHGKRGLRRIGELPAMRKGTSCRTPH